MQRLDAFYIPILKNMPKSTPKNFREITKGIAPGKISITNIVRVGLYLILALSNFQKTTLNREVDKGYVQSIY